MLFVGRQVLGFGSLAQHGAWRATAVRRVRVELRGILRPGGGSGLFFNGTLEAINNTFFCLFLLDSVRVLVPPKTKQAPVHNGFCSRATLAGRRVKMHYVSPGQFRPRGLLACRTNLAPQLRSVLRTVMRVAEDQQRARRQIAAAAAFFATSLIGQPCANRDPPSSKALHASQGAS